MSLGCEFCVLCCGSVCSGFVSFVLFFFKQKTAYEMRISDWSSDVCSSDLNIRRYLSQPRLRLAWIIPFGRSTLWTTFFVYPPLYIVEQGGSDAVVAVMLDRTSVV